MGALANKRILLGVAGGIAAYKCPDLVRRLRDAGAEVRVVLTRAGAEFVTPLTLQAVSGHPVHSELLDAETESVMGHIELGRWADAVLIAPATANFLARLAQGRAEDLLSALCLAATCPLAVAPAMNQAMWQKPATQANIQSLLDRGVTLLGPASGVQACGETGPGRMLEPPDLAAALGALFETGEMDGLRVLVTAGPTWEAIDPVRGLTNRSSGRMGYAVATAAMEAGARVTLISGPTSLPDPDRLDTVRVGSAREMLNAVLARMEHTDVFVAVAAVADYRPAEESPGKIKKGAERITLELVRNPDILATVCAEHPNVYTVGFAAETDDLEIHARAKLTAKGADLIAANRVGLPGVGFEADDNGLWLVDRDGAVTLPIMPKSRLARMLVAEIARRYHAKGSAESSRFAHRR
jgi:phosphopantothenoylcysteine decarboxylase/phosphopantothenate--cysteine ligase